VGVCVKVCMCGCEGGACEGESVHVVCEGEHMWRCACECVMMNAHVGVCLISSYSRFQCLLELPSSRYPSNEREVRVTTPTLH